MITPSPKAFHRMASLLYSTSSSTQLDWILRVWFLFVRMPDPLSACGLYVMRGSREAVIQNPVIGVLLNSPEVPKRCLRLLTDHVSCDLLEFYHSSICRC